MYSFLDQFIQLSARIGSDSNLVQAGGGNTSLKHEGTLWIKASGKWLIHAATDDMFLPVPLADIERNLASREERFAEYTTRSGVSLRPSVETTMHAVLPQRVVIHVHSVNTIPWASQTDGHEKVAPLLTGFRWSWIPYTHPGVPLALRIRDELTWRPEVLILENHGLVVAAETCAAAEEVLKSVENRLNTHPLTVSTPPNLEKLAALCSGTHWQPAEDKEVHALAMNRRHIEIAMSGTLFPDQCVYVGPGAAVLQEDDSFAQAVETYRTRYNFDPVFLVVPDAGVVIQKNLKRAARELLLCVARVIERIPPDARVTYLHADEVAKLMNWDAEKYRLQMARTSGQ
jgi:rhamnose utilization protein RhaD (predicted bifunctional aldolase and dehydrogenase)